MRINLLHNKIVQDTASQAFIESFNKAALPVLSERYPDVSELVIYEDYLSLGLTVGGTFYCPLTLVSGTDISRAYATWRVDAKRFENQVPYAYIGKEPLNIEISDEAPAEIEEKIKGRVPYFVSDAVKLTVEASAPTKTFLSGKYSQAFIDLMREELTRALEAEFSVAELSESTLEFKLVFAPESFMEHVADNSSYRRLLLTAKACSPRDLWIKWTRLDGSGTYTVSSNVKKGDIVFEIPDEVPEKIREREYRYLIRLEGMPAYKNAMSRKNFTEWRELLKRVIKRGEAVKLEPVVNESEAALFNACSVEAPAPVNEDCFDSEISLKLQSVLEGYNIEAEPAEPENEEDINPDITELLRSLLEGNNDDETEEVEEAVDEVEELPPFEIEEIESEPQEEIEDEALVSNEDGEKISDIEEINESLRAKISELEAEKARLEGLVTGYERAAAEARREREILIQKLDAAARREERERDRLAEAARIAVAERRDGDAAEEDKDGAIKEKALAEEALEAQRLAEAKREEERLLREKAEEIKSAPVRYVSKTADITFRHQVDPNITRRIQEIIVTTVKYFDKENVYMKIKATIPDPYMVRLEFVKIPENESALLADIIRVLGHSKIGIVKVLLN